jgi:hypothetical protein
MPSTRQRRTRTPTTLSLRALGLGARITFLTGWHPPTSEFERLQSPRWRSYRDFLNDYRAVREEMLTWRPAQPDDFAEELYRRVAADPRGDVDVIGRAVWVWKYPTFTMWMIERSTCPVLDDDERADG